MREKKHPILWMLTASFFLSALVLFVLFRFVLPPPASASPVPPYTLRAWQGQVAVFEGAQRYPMQVYDVYVNALPQELRQRLAEGIPVYSETELSLLLEDYTG